LKTLKELALEAWNQEQEKRKQSEHKKRKRLAKKIEEEINDLLPKDADDCELQRNLDDSRYGVVVTTGEALGALQFTHDDKDNLVLIGDCAACRARTLSKPIADLADLGQLLENFQPGSEHDCPHKRN
jgi:hypothetical protein